MLYKQNLFNRHLYASFSCCDSIQLSLTAALWFFFHAWLKPLLGIWPSPQTLRGISLRCQMYKIQRTYACGTLSNFELYPASVCFRQTAFGVNKCSFRNSMGFLIAHSASLDSALFPDVISFELCTNRKYSSVGFLREKRKDRRRKALSHSLSTLCL